MSGITVDELNVLIGDSDEPVIEIVTELSKEVVGGDRELGVYSSHKADRILELAESHPIDLLVLFLNNILFHHDNMPPCDRMRQALRLVSDLKVKYDRPIIVICGLPEYERQAMMVGADYFFQRPFDLNEFRDALSDCLSGSTCR